jgi:hypothetical protein
MQCDVIILLNMNKINKIIIEPYIESLYSRDCKRLVQLSNCVLYHFAILNNKHASQELKREIRDLNWILL